MGLIRGQFSIGGFIESEVVAGLDDLREEFAQRTWLRYEHAGWDAERQRLVVLVGKDGEDAADDGPDVQGLLDELWDIVIVCIPFSGKGIQFHVDSVHRAQ